ncbi:MAG: LysR family transcriptional regulator [Hyphomicrobiales bacterium]|nr:LysR family transcriptional regulator [Hyphomicrobiales bacterium]
MSFTTSWDDFMLVNAIAECGSLVGAAEKLGINHSTAFRRLGALEKNLGSRLFERARSGYTTTPAGDEMVDLATRIAENVADFERAVAGRDVKPAGTLRITTNDTFASFLLAPVFASFRAAYPDIFLDIIVTHQALNLSRRDADIAIRATSEPPETLVGRKLPVFAWCCYAPDEWLDNGELRDPLPPWIGYGQALNVLPAAKWLQQRAGPPGVVCRFDTLNGIAHGIAAGLGVAAIPCFIGDQIPGISRTGDLLYFGDALWLLTHADLRHSARVRAFMDHAAAELASRKALIEGR